MILFIQTAFLGDLLLSIPTLKHLRKNFPEKKIHVVCRKGLGSILKKFNLADEIHDDFKGTKPTIVEWRERFKNLHFDVLICPHESLRSKILCYFTKARLKIAYCSFLSRFIFNECVNRPMHLPEALRQLSLIQPLVPELDLSSLHKKFIVYKSIPTFASMSMFGPSHRVNSKKKLSDSLNIDSSHSIIAIAPGSVWPTKRWPIENFVQVAKTLIDQQSVVIILGSFDERVFGEEIQRRVPEVINMCGETSLTELPEVLSACDLLISNDSGSMHMASVVETPIVSIFGPTILEFGYQPWSNHFEVLETENLKCRPCSSHGGEYCPIGTHECMKMIHPERVISSARTLVDIK